MKIRKKSKLTENILELYSNKLTNIEIADLLKIPVKKVISDLNRYSLKSNRYLSIDSDILDQFIIGSLLGDGYLSKISGLAKQSSMVFAHGVKQKEYCQYKHNFLNDFKLAGKFRYYENIDNRFKNKLNQNYTFKSKSNPIFSKYRNFFYKDNIKIINKDFITKIDSFGLAIWFMDDGSKATHGYMIYTCSFSKEEVLFLIKLLKDKFNIEASYHSYYNSIYIKLKSVINFTNIIKPYIIPSMIYKLHEGSV